MCFVNASPCSSTLRIHCARRAQREVQHLDRVPRRQRPERAVRERVVSAGDGDLRIRAVRDLDDRPVEARRVVDRRVLRQARGHALRKELPVVGPRDERAPEALHDAVLLRDRRQHFLQRAAARPPELVRIRVDHPVRAVLARPRAAPCASPTRPGAGPRPARGSGGATPSRSYRSRISVVPSLRVVVRRDDEVGARVEVERDLRVDDVGLVAREHRDDEPHRRQQLLRRAPQLPLRRVRPAARSIVSRRCSSVSRRRCSRTTSASPSAATSTAYAASSTTVGRGNVERLAVAQACRARRAGACRSRASRPPARARALRRRRRASRTAPARALRR